MNTNFSSYFTRSVEVIQGHRYDYTYALLRNPHLMHKAYELGIDRVRCRVCCAFQLLFAVKPDFAMSVRDVFSSIKFPSRPYAAIHLRAPSGDNEGATAMAEELIGCAHTALEELNVQRCLIVPVFNNRLLIDTIVRKYPLKVKRLFASPDGLTGHTHLGNIPRSVNATALSLIQRRTFHDFYILLNSLVLVRSKGHMASLGTIADAIRRHINGPDAVSVTYIASGGTCSRQLVNQRIE